MGGRWLLFFGSMEHPKSDERGEFREQLGYMDGTVGKQRRKGCSSAREEDDGLLEIDNNRLFLPIRLQLAWTRFEIILTLRRPPAFSLPNQEAMYDTTCPAIAPLAVVDGLLSCLPMPALLVVPRIARSMT